MHLQSTKPILTNSLISGLCFKYHRSPTLPPLSPTWSFLFASTSSQSCLVHLFQLHKISVDGFSSSLGNEKSTSKTNTSEMPISKHQEVRSLYGWGRPRERAKPDCKTPSWQIKKGPGLPQSPRPSTPCLLTPESSSQHPSVCSPQRHCTSTPVSAHSRDPAPAPQRPCPSTTVSAHPRGLCLSTPVSIPQASSLLSQAPPVVL